MEKLDLLSGVGNEEVITSLDIARVVNKPHNDVMKAIRKMEAAWTKVTQGNFSLSRYKDSTGRSLPCYELTKLETLFIATKFNDEARAKLVLYCDYLEQREKARLSEALAIAEKEAEYARRVLGSNGTLTTTEIAKELGLTAQKLHKMLHEQGVIYRLPRAKTWCLYAPYDELGLVEYETRVYQRGDGRTYTKRIERWSEKGHKLINERVEDHSNFRVPESIPHCIELTLQFVF